MKKINIYINMQYNGNTHKYARVRMCEWEGDTWRDEYLRGI